MQVIQSSMKRKVLANSGRAHLCIAVVTCGSLHVAPSVCWHGPAGGREDFSVRCAADSRV